MAKECTTLRMIEVFKGCKAKYESCYQESERANKKENMILDVTYNKLLLFSF